MKRKRVFGQCHVCRMNKTLLTHHIQYEPIEKTIRICTKCHARIHLARQFENLRPSHESARQFYLNKRITVGLNAIFSTDGELLNINSAKA